MSFETLLNADREYQRLANEAARACEARSNLPAGCSRARVTTANARWATKAEARDRRMMALRAEYERQGTAP